MAVKGSQVRLEKSFDDYFNMGMLVNYEGDSYMTEEKSRGRHEARMALVNSDLSVLEDLAFEWPGLKQWA